MPLDPMIEVTSEEMASPDFLAEYEVTFDPELSARMLLAEVDLLRAQVALGPVHQPTLSDFAPFCGV